MTVRAACASCGSQFAAQPYLYGKRVPCPNCGGVVDVPQPEPVSEVQPPLADLGGGAGAPFADPLSGVVSSSASHAAPVAGPLAGLPMQTAPAAKPSVRVIYHEPDTSLSDDDKRVIWYAIAGIAGILLLVGGAIALSQWLSNRGTPQPENPSVAPAQTGDSTSPAPSAAPSTEGTPPPTTPPPGSGATSTPPGSGTSSTPVPTAKSP
jgi:hypothetical protein